MLSKWQSELAILPKRLLRYRKKKQAPRCFRTCFDVRCEL